MSLSINSSFICGDSDIPLRTTTYYIDSTISAPTATSNTGFHSKTSKVISFVSPSTLDYRNCLGVFYPPSDSYARIPPCTCGLAKSKAEFVMVFSRFESKQLTCWYWKHEKSCRFSDTECRYSQSVTGKNAPRPGANVFSEGTLDIGDRQVNFDI